MDATTARVVDYALRMRFPELNKETVHQCKRRLIDTLACAVAAYAHPLCEKARATARRYSGAGAASSVIGCDWQTMPEAAAFANGVLMRMLDMTDTYLSKSPGHPSDAIAAVLPVAEAVKASGAELINAVALAYDTYCTFCDAVDIHHRGWDQPVCVGLGSVVAAGKLLALDREQLAHAIALMLVPNMALLQTRRGELSHWKGCAAPNAARNAVFAAYLARDGYTGPGDAFEGKYGMWNQVGKFDWQLSGDVGGARKVEQTHMKCFPIVYHAQTSAWAGMQAHKEVRIEDISEILLESYHLAVDMNGTDPSRWAPKTHETADHSLPYILAVALLDGAISADSFSDSRLNDPRIAALMKKMKIQEAPELTARYPQAAACRLTLRLAGGREFSSEIEYPKGHVSNPMSDAELETKFRDAFRDFASRGQCHQVLSALWSLESCADVGELLALLTTASSAQKAPAPSA